MLILIFIFLAASGPPSVLVCTSFASLTTTIKLVETIIYNAKSLNMEDTNLRRDCPFLNWFSISFMPAFNCIPRRSLNHPITSASPAVSYLQATYMPTINFSYNKNHMNHTKYKLVPLPYIVWRPCLRWGSPLQPINPICYLCNEFFECIPKYRSCVVRLFLER